MNIRAWLLLLSKKNPLTKSGKTKTGNCRHFGFTPGRTCLEYLSDTAKVIYLNADASFVLKY